MSHQQAPAARPADAPASDQPPETAISCPLCQFVGTAESDVYVHLQTRHRKSTIAEAVVKGTEPRPATNLRER